MSHPAGAGAPSGEAGANRPWFGCYETTRPALGLAIVEWARDHIAREVRT